MTRLVERSAAHGLLPIVRGGATLSERVPEAITSVAPFRGREAAVSKALKAACGVALPAPGRAEAKGAAVCLWSGRGQALLLGPAPGALEGAALTDQGDAWAVLRIEGPAAEAVLARLVPLDLRAAAFPEGAAARTMLFHMMLAIRRAGPQAFELMVFRSMAATAVHELDTAMRSVAAQAG
jgi:sarcosine oxidase subunit gamma